MVIGMAAAYVPMLFPQSAPEAAPENYSDVAPVTSTENYAAQLPKEVKPGNPTTTTASSSLPDSFSGLQDELKGILDK